MATHSSVLVQRIPGTGEAGRLPSMGSHRVRHNWRYLAAEEEHIMRNAGLDEAQAGIKIAGRNFNNHKYADDTTLMVESGEELRSFLIKMKKESEKVGLKLNIQKMKFMASGPITSWQIDGETVSDFILGGSNITADGDCSQEIESCLIFGRKAMTNLDSIFQSRNRCFSGTLLLFQWSSLDSVLKSRDITLVTKVHLVKAMVFPVVMNGCELGHKESWAPKNWCFWIVVLEKTLESSLDYKEIQPVHPTGNQSWIFIGGTDSEAETPILWLPDAKNWLIWKDPEAGKDWRQEKGMTEDEMFGWHHGLKGHEFE